MWTSFVGFMASGKTTVARFLGQSTMQPALDLDAEVERLTGLTVPEIFASGGVQRFRALEWEAASGLPARSPLWLATGGGCVESLAVAKLLRQRGVVIWLDAPWEVLRGRIEADGLSRRPMVGHLGWAGMAALYRRRLRQYAKVAHFRLRIDRRDAATVARHALLRSLLWQRQWQERESCE